MKNKIATIGIIIATLILAGVAVFTAVRLYQLRQEAVAPTAPTSKPKAQGAPTTTSCSALSFVLGSTPTPTPTCPVNSTCCASPLTRCTAQPPPAGQCPTGYQWCYAGFCIKDNYNSATNTCPTSPSPTATPTGSPTATPTGTATPTATPTNPPGEPNSCGGTCGSNANCNSGLFCYSGFCRNPSCPTQTSCSCPSGTSTPTPKLTSIPKSTPTPTQASLPDAGTSLPTIFGIGIGTLLLIGAIILAL